MRLARKRGRGQLARQLLSLFWLLPVLVTIIVNLALVCKDHQSGCGPFRLANCEATPTNRTGHRTLSHDDNQKAEKSRQQQQQQSAPVISNDNKGTKPASGKNKHQASRVKSTTNAQQTSVGQQQRLASAPARIQKGASQMTTVIGGNQKQQKSADLWRANKSLRRPQQDESLDLQAKDPRQQATTPTSVQDEPQENLGSSGGLQVSITPRVSLVRVPVESNTMLKCLISSQTNKFTKPFKVSWSRYRYDENDYEQIESESYDSETAPVTATVGDQAQERSRRESGSRLKRDDGAQQADEQQAGTEAANNNSLIPESQPPTLINRQQQLRDFLARSRQETNVISDLLVEATLSISPVKASDNATYFCTATHGRSANEMGAQQQQQAQIDLLALSKPQVRLDRVQPARNSKSALVFWSILSEGNAPIYKTILMVRNDSQTLLELRQANRYKFQQQQTTQESQQSNDGQQQQQHRSSVVLDGDYNQWQRIDIPGDGGTTTTEELSQHERTENRGRRPSTSAYSDGGLAEDSVVRADVDVTSINLDRSASQDTEFSGQNRSSARRLVHDPRRSYNLTHLLPGVTYQLRLAALNDMGQSDWSQLSATMPNEIPAQISELRVLSKTNDSLTIGWRRPPYDGAQTIRYEMQLFDLNRTMTLDANTNNTLGARWGPTQTQRNAFMFYFVNLQPGTDYHFHIRACSLAGCSAYSTPKLAASTLDGEPDEPLDVELICQPALGQIQVTWLPPVQVRGRLLNYTVTLESQSHYRNQSGQWTSEQRQVRLDTTDNHTLSLEFGGNNQQQPSADGRMRLLPNTNYTGRVCANNRSPRCGRWSQVSSKARCSTPPELPSELPANIRLGLKRLKMIDVEQTKPEPETLVLELPFISWRNGSIDCIQVILIRLPSSFDSSRRALSEFLPDDPAEIKLHEYLDLIDTNAADTDQDGQNNSPKTSNRLRDSPQALAYLAEELDQISQSGTNEEITNGMKQILLGDGVQSSCAQVWAKIRQQEVDEEERKSAEARKKSTVEQKAGQADTKRILQAIDGSLIAQTHYTGFLKLVQLRFNEKRQSANSLRRRSTGNVEVLTKYSNYFSPVKTDLQVPEVSMESLLSNDQSADYANGDQTNRAYNELDERFCDSKLIVNIQNKLGTNRPCKMALSVAGSIRRTTIKFYRKMTGFLEENLRMDSLTKLFSTSSPPLQLLEMGLLVFLGASFLLFLIYLFTLPSAMRRKRKRQEIKRQLLGHEASAAAASSTNQKSPQRQLQDEAAGFAAQQQPSADGNWHTTSRKSQQQIVQPNLQALASSLGYQQVHEATGHDDQAQLNQQAHVVGYGTLNRSKECPIHSSPMSQVVSTSHHKDHHQQNGSDATRRQSVHVCQAEAGEMPEEQQQARYIDHSHNNYQQDQQAQRHHHHHRSTYHIHQDEGAGQIPDWSETRNCRTMRRSHQQQQPINGFAESAQLGHHHQHGQQQHANHFAGYAQYHQTVPHPNYTMTMQHETVITLAKKINKSLPLSLFQSVFECRLKNGWLREEYEQLPRVANIQMQPAIAKVNEDGRHIKLRPQLIVSRDDSVSALISGNDKYDGSLVKLQLPVTGSPNSGHMIEKQFICAKSPIDADSVWDFWRLVYEQEVSSLVMLTPNEDTHTGELRCAQYWPTCDNEETTILSPCNEYVQQSSILPAKFKIRQETLTDLEMDGERDGRSDEFKIRRLTLLVMATRPSENDQTNATTPTTTNDDTSKLNMASSPDGDQMKGTTNGSGQQSQAAERKAEGISNGEDVQADDEESLVIIERTLLHFQFLHWNASSASNQMRLIKFIELVNERHSRQVQQQASPGTHWQQVTPQNPILVHCANGIGRSGLFTAMSYIVDDLSLKLSTLAGTSAANQPRHQQQQKMVAKVNLFHLVSKLRNQRDMLLSPYRFYELLYQLATRCIPAHHNHPLSSTK